ncbi:hypothetical protein B2J93_2919 [Marssonina coronariae]|uniref:Uncharacterized protein n=1 Tax=Diplocarpon coronariae TaxID=2795749 RepID=A0A218YV02_9HELO|nr:hypothetical protein B2J93_2919 [Marssonina coronariae]
MATCISSNQPRGLDGASSTRRPVFTTYPTVRAHPEIPTPTTPTFTSEDRTSLCPQIAQLPPLAFSSVLENPDG